MRRQQGWGTVGYPGRVRCCDAGSRQAMRLLLCICALNGLMSGCTPTIPYQPNARLVDTLGVAQAKQRLKETTLRSINPQIVDADVTDDFLRYRFRQVIAAFPTGAIVDHQIAFLNAVHVDVFTNNVVNVRTSANHLIAQLVFGNEQDARTFADLLTSFRQRRVR